MVKTPDKIFIAGPPDIVDPDDPLAAFEGRKGALLWAASPEDGNMLAEHRLEHPPIFDGICAAQQKLLLADEADYLWCFE